MWPKSGLIGDKNMVMGRSGYRGIGSFGGGCGSMGARRPFVVCNDQLLHFWIVQSSDALSGSHHGHTVQVHTSASNTTFASRSWAIQLEVVIRVQRSE